MKKIAIAISIVFLSGCATKPLVDPKSSKNPANYYLDEMECNRIADEISMSTEVAKGATIQGVLSALLGAALAKGNISAGTGSGIGLATGVLMGGGSAAVRTHERKQKVLRTCLAGRGYSILE
jgi:hypothetical protein